MKCLRCTLLRPARISPPTLLRRTPLLHRSFATELATPLSSSAAANPLNVPGSTTSPSSLPKRPGPAIVAPSRRPLESAKLTALHARLNLNPSFKIETLARCLIDKSADSNPLINNASLAYLGNNLLGYSASEHLMTVYPRLPIATLDMAMFAYVGNKALASVGKGWGVEAAFEPTAEVDPGYLQLARLQPGDEPWVRWAMMQGVKARTLLEADDEIPIPGEPKQASASQQQQQQTEQHALGGIPLEYAYSNFVKSVFAGVYLHEGPDAYRQFFRQHILSRHLDVYRLFNFRQATRLLSRLCTREGFEQPIARLLSETGRKSRTPVFVVGVFSGNEMLAEGTGASLNEARRRAAANALIAYFTYSPPEGVRGDLPSSAREGEPFRAGVIDVGDVVA